MNSIQYKTDCRDIHRMAYPILLNYVLSSVFELLDKAIVGHYSVRGFAVVGIAASFTFAITGALGILSAAFNIVAAGERGSCNEPKFESAFAVSKSLALLIGTVFFALSLLGGRFFFRHVYGIRGADLSELLSYFYPAAFTVIQNMLIFQYSAYFRNRLNTRITLYSTIVSTGVNLFFDYSLVYGFFGMPCLGTAGAAWGSVIGLAAGLLVYQLTYYRTGLPVKPALGHTAKEAAGKILRLYPSLFGQEMLESTIFACIVSAVVARLGTEQMAVYNLLDTAGSAIGLPVYAYAAATQTYSLQSRSAGNMRAVRRYLKSGLFLTSLVIGLLCIFCRIFDRPLLQLIVTDDHIIQQAQQLLGPAFLLQFARIPYQIYMNYLQGIGREKYVLIGTAAGTACAGIGVIIAGNAAGLTGLYLVMAAELCILGTCYIFRVRKSLLNPR